MYHFKNSFTGLNAKSIDFSVFKSVCYTLQDLNLIKLHQVHNHKHPINFYEAIISDSRGKYSFLLNRFVSEGGFRIEINEEEIYIDNPELKTAISTLNTEYHLLSSEILNSNVAPEHLALLGEQEKKATNTWLPTLVGNLLFTWYF